MQKATKESLKNCKGNRQGTPLLLSVVFTMGTPVLPTGTSARRRYCPQYLTCWKKTYYRTRARCVLKNVIKVQYIFTIKPRKSITTIWPWTLQPFNLALTKTKKHLKVQLVVFVSPHDTCFLFVLSCF